MCQGEPGPVCTSFRYCSLGDLQELAKAALDVQVVGCGKVSGEVRAKPSQCIVCPGRRAIQQQKPAGLEVRDSWECIQKVLLLLPQLCQFRLDALIRAKWQAQNPEASLFRG